MFASFFLNWSCKYRRTNLSIANSNNQTPRKDTNEENITSAFVDGGKLRNGF